MNNFGHIVITGSDESRLRWLMKLINPDPRNIPISPDTKDPVLPVVRDPVLPVVRDPVRPLIKDTIIICPPGDSRMFKNCKKVHGIISSDEKWDRFDLVLSSACDMMRERNEKYDANLHVYVIFHNCINGSCL